MSPLDTAKGQNSTGQNSHCVNTIDDTQDEGLPRTRTLSLSSPAVGPMVERDLGAVQRRRHRQLRSFLKHERMTLRMTLAEALHHSCGVGPEGTNYAPRGPKTARRGERLGVLEEPEPQLV